MCQCATHDKYGHDFFVSNKLFIWNYFQNNVIP